MKIDKDSMIKILNNRMECAKRIRDEYPIGTTLYSFFDGEGQECDELLSFLNTLKEDAEHYFPELKESKDEKIRKTLIRFFKDQYSNDTEMYDGSVTVGEALAWLEKQGKSSDQIHYWTEEEIEPIISDYLRGAEHYGGMIGRLRCLKPKSLEKQGNCSVKWQKNTPENKPPKNHSVLMKTVDGIAEGEWDGKYWHQYRWSTHIYDSNVLYWIELHDLDEQGEQKQEWSEEDEKMFDFCCDYLDDNQINWLKSLKDRIKGKED